MISIINTTWHGLVVKFPKVLSVRSNNCVDYLEAVMKLFWKLMTMYPTFDYLTPKVMPAIFYFFLELVNDQLILFLFIVQFPKQNSSFGIFLHGSWYDNSKSNHDCTSDQKVAGVEAVIIYLRTKLETPLFKNHFCS